MDTPERDPHGRDAHEPGAKLDNGKLRPDLVFRGFAHALTAVAEVGTFGADKYTDDGWRNVPDGETRYKNAKLRHQLAEDRGEIHDPDSGLPHAAHEAWNALARLELMLARHRTIHLPEIMATSKRGELSSPHNSTTGQMTHD